MKKIFKKNQLMITALAIMIAIAGYLNFAGTKVSKEELMKGGNGEAVETVNDKVTSDQSSNLLDISEEDLASLTDIESLDSEITFAATDLSEEELAALEKFEDEDTQVASVEGAATEVSSTDVAAADKTMTEGDIPGEAVFASTNHVGTLSGAKLLKEQTRAKNKQTLLDIINSSSIENAQKQVAIDNMIKLTEISEKETASEILLEAKGFSEAVVSISDACVDVCINDNDLTDAKRAQIEDVVKRKTGMSAENIIITPVNTK